MSSIAPTAPSVLEAWNQAMFLHINAPVDTPLWLIELARFVAVVPMYALPFVLLGLWCWSEARYRSAVLRAILVTACGLLLSLLIGLAWPHPRPFALGLGHAWLAHAANASFPSDHLTIFACLAISLLFDEAYRVGLLLAASGLAVGYCRVYLGIHFPLDMLGALALAAVSNSAAWLLWQRYGERLTRHLVSGYRRSLGPVIQRGWIRP
ncbi:MAG: putative undecaprenyl-diphosphatase YbjG [Pseudomonas citronellolis]|nr:MAG: putative undecaprenyl-diphosphatase YbjG [Pseudomonas citronellolis]